MDIFHERDCIQDSARREEKQAHRHLAVENSSERQLLRLWTTS